MKVNYHTEIRFARLPFSMTEKDIIYVESEYNEEFNRFIQLYYHEICDDFKSKGYNLIYLPRLSEEQLGEIIKNVYPDYDKLTPDTLSLKSNFMLDFLVDDDKQYYFGPSLIYTTFPPHNIYGEDDEEGAEFWLNIVSIEDLESCYLANDLSPVLNEIDEEINNWDNNERRAMDDDFDWSDLFLDEENIYDDDKNILESEEIIQKVAKDSKKKTKILIEEVNDKIKELNRQDKNFSVIRYYLRREVMPLTRISDIHVTNRCEILLPEYNIELKLSAQFKALYLLYLNHPEGINYQNIGKECKDELLQWFKWSNPRDPDEDKINNLFVPKEKGREPIIELISRIKSELTKYLGGGLAKKYCIEKDTNGIHRIYRNGYKVQIDKKYHFRNDQTPHKKEGSSCL